MTRQITYATTAEQRTAKNRLKRQRKKAGRKGGKKGDGDESEGEEDKKDDGEKKRKLGGSGFVFHKAGELSDDDEGPNEAVGPAQVEEEEVEAVPEVAPAVEAGIVIRDED